jgi:probable F420-dependent oxidoreductase
MTGPAPTLSISLRNFATSARADWSHLLRTAQVADRAGIGRLWVVDHVVFGDNTGAHADPRLGGGGYLPAGPDGAWLEPLTVLSFVASATSRIRLGTGVLQAALRPSAVLAKTVATLDALSGGRLDLGVGVGWQREEYQATGADFASRGAALDRTLEQCRQLWGEGPARLQVGDQDVAGIRCVPKPLQPGGVPIWVSGTSSPRTLRRLTRFGSGWIPWGDDVTDPGPGLRRIAAAMVSEGRDPADLQVRGNLPVRLNRDGSCDAEATVAAVPALLAAGFTDLRLAPPSSVATEDLVAGFVPIAELFRSACASTDEETHWSRHLRYRY